MPPPFSPKEPDNKGSNDNSTDESGGSTKIVWAIVVIVVIIGVILFWRFSKRKPADKKD
jgi:hypothetical protein